jgi:hypothetical protein
MKVSVVRGGGLAGLVTTSELDSADLADPDAHALRTAVDRARAEQPPTAGGPSVADRFRYEVSVEDEGRTETVRAGEPGVPDGLRELITLVEGSPARKRHTAPPH